MRKTLLLLASMALAVLIACGVTLMAGTEPAQAAFPGANGKIVFDEYNDPESDYGIKLINPNGSGLVTLLDDSAPTQVAISPDGTRVAYASGRSDRNSWEIYKINISNRRITQITNNDVYDGHPTWKPDGTRVAFERGELIRGSIENTDILVRRADGTGTTANLTNTPDEDEFAPAWSPNGEDMAFYTETSEDVFVLNLESGQRRNLTDDGTARRDTNPSWSPDGTRIVFDSFAFEERPPSWTSSDSIYTMNASDGSDRRLLAKGWQDAGFDGTYFHGPTYSPDGKKIAYVRTAVDYVYSRPQLFKMNASDGSNKQLVYNAFNSGSGYPYGEGVGLGSPDWGVKVQR